MSCEVFADFIECLISSFHDRATCAAVNVNVNKTGKHNGVASVNIAGFGASRIVPSVERNDFSFMDVDDDIVPFHAVIGDGSGKNAI